MNGLQKGNNIWFSGVKIGTIKKIVLLGNAKVEADMNIEEHSHQFVRKDAKAKISSDGLIGSKIIVKGICTGYNFDADMGIPGDVIVTRCFITK